MTAIAIAERPTPRAFPTSRDILLQVLEHAHRALLDVIYACCSRRRIGLDSYQAGNTSYPSFARYGLPYGLTDVGDDRAILVNRDYKPVGVGIPYSYWVDYAAFPQWHLSGATLARLRAAPCWVTNQEGLNHFMFHDGCPPWASARDLRAYEARLRALIHAYSEGIAAGPPWP